MRNTKKSANDALCSIDSGRIDKGNAVPVVPSREEFSFTTEDFENLCQNEYYRFVPNSNQIGNAVISSNGKQLTACQYKMPCSEGNAPTWIPLKNITPISRFGRTAYQAQTLEGNTVYASRSYRFTDENDNSFTFLPFSPPPKRKKEPFWGSTKQVPITKNQLRGKNEIIGGRELEVHPESVALRIAETRRYPDQNTVMGMSAKEAYEFYYEEMADKLTPEIKFIFERAINADIRNPFESNFRPEWLHAEGYSLTPIWIDPQRVDNLGSAAKWANTAMMVLERVAKWYALNCPESFVTIKPTFEMLLDTYLIKTIDFEIRVGFEDRFLRFYQHLEPLCQKHPVFPKASDIAQMTGISHAILSDKEPISTSVISSAPEHKKAEHYKEKSLQLSRRQSKISSFADGKEIRPVTDNVSIEERSRSAKASKMGMFSDNNHKHHYNLRERPTNSPCNAIT